MIDFACKTFRKEDIIKCSLSLSKSDYDIMDYMLSSDEEYTTNKLSKKLGFDVTTIQRSVKSLYEKGILLRSQQNLKNGGYIFSYRINDKKVIRKMIIGIIKRWVEKVEVEINKI